MTKEEILKRKLEVSKILFIYNVPVDKAKVAGAFIEDLEQENQQLKEEVEELKLIVGLRQKRNLISKFDKEYDEEDKEKNPDRKYAGTVPDAEEVYKRYYELKEQLKQKYDNFPKTVKNLSKEQLESLYLDLLHVENEKSKQLKQQNEVIDKVDELITEYLCTVEYCGLNAPMLADLFSGLLWMLKK